MILTILQVLAGISLSFFLIARIFSIPHLKALHDFQQISGRNFWESLSLLKADKSISSFRMVRMYYLSLNCLFTSDIMILLGFLPVPIKWLNNLLGWELIGRNYLDLFSVIVLSTGMIIGWVSAICTSQIGSFIGWCIFDLKPPKWIIRRLYAKFFLFR